MAAKMDMGLRCIKYLLICVNCLFVITGVMIISVGTTIYTVYDDFSHFLDSSYLSPATILISVGIIVFIISIFGCCGAIKESTCMVLVFAVSLSVVLVLEFAAAFAAYLLQDGIKGALESKIYNIMDRYNTYADDRTAMDILQSNLHCCGVYGRSDWSQSLGDDVRVQFFPDSCCANTSWNTGLCTTVYVDGCFGRLVTIINRSVLYLSTGALAIALIQFTGIMFACVLGRAIRRQKTERERRRWELRRNLIDGYEPIGKKNPEKSFPVVYMQPPDSPTKVEPVS